MQEVLSQADIDGSIRLHGGESSGRDIPYIKHRETRRTSAGVHFERVTYTRKEGADDSEPLPEDYTRIIGDAELEAEYDGLREDKPRIREYGDCPPRYCGMCLRGDCKHQSGGDISNMSIEPLYKYIAVDFDGTLNEHRFPEIGQAYPAVIEFIKFHAERGTKIILHTCRDNEPDGGRQYLDEAVAWCKAEGVPLHAVNENPFVPFGKRKLYADIYIDDRALNVSAINGHAPAHEP